MSIKQHVKALVPIEGNATWIRLKIVKFCHAQYCKETRCLVVATMVTKVVESRLLIRKT